MKSLFVTLFSLSTLFTTAQDRIDGLALLSNYMIGSFNSSEQAASDTNYFNIRLDMHRIWQKKTDGIWLYVEQSINTKEAKPYRQRVYHLEQLGQNEFKSTIYKLDSAALYVGLHHDKDRELQLKESNIELLPGCALILSFNGKSFIGETKKGECLNKWGEASYATSEVSVFEDYMISWDRGWNEKDEYVWGAEKAGYLFKKQ